MLPPFPIHELGDITARDGKSLGDLYVLQSTSREFADFMNIFGFKPRHSIRFTWKKPTAHSGFSFAIQRVVSLGSKKEMFGIHTSTIVAMMQNAEAMWDCSMPKFPREPMRQWSLAFSSSDREQTISRRDESTSPLPAQIGFVDVRPKATDVFSLKHASSLLHREASWQR